MIIVLVAVAVVSGGLLAWVNNVTEAPIKEQDELALANGIKSVMGVDDLTVTANDEITKNIGGKDYTFRSEERRVGKECRSRWSPYH